MKHKGRAITEEKSQILNTEHRKRISSDKPTARENSKKKGWSQGCQSYNPWKDKTAELDLKSHIERQKYDAAEEDDVAQQTLMKLHENFEKYL